jgi:transposase-like protein
VRRRLAVLRHAEEVTSNVALTCRYFGISRQLYYTWRRRYQADGPEGCVPGRDGRRPGCHRHRVVERGSRQINMTLHMMAVVQLRNTTEGRAYYDREVAAGKTPNEAMRCLKRRLSDVVYKTMLDDLVASKTTGAGDGSGRTPGKRL